MFGLFAKHITRRTAQLNVALNRRIPTNRAKQTLRILLNSYIQKTTTTTTTALMMMMMMIAVMTTRSDLFSVFAVVRFGVDVLILVLLNIIIKSSSHRYSILNDNDGDGGNNGAADSLICPMRYVLTSCVFIQ